MQIALLVASLVVGAVALWLPNKATIRGPAYAICSILSGLAFLVGPNFIGFLVFAAWAFTSYSAFGTQ